MNTTTNRTEIGLLENERVVLRKNSIGGLITWDTIIRKDRLSVDLAIATTENFDRVIINGADYEPLDPNKQVAMKTAQDFEAKVKEHNIERWNIHDCSMCGDMCGYVFFPDGEVGYDSGCYCVSYSGLRRSSFEEVAKHYNMQINEKYIAEMDKFWHFEPANPSTKE